MCLITEGCPGPYQGCYIIYGKYKVTIFLKIKNKTHMAPRVSSKDYGPTVTFLSFSYFRNRNPNFWLGHRVNNNNSLPFTEWLWCTRHCFIYTILIDLNTEEWVFKSEILEFMNFNQTFPLPQNPPSWSARVRSWASHSLCSSGGFHFSLIRGSILHG